MFKNFIKIAWRNSRKNGLYSLINVIGLAAGLTACILIGLYIWNELSYDRFHSEAGRIARVTMEYKSAGTVEKVAVTGTKIGPLMQRTFPQVKAFARVFKAGRSMANGATVFDEKKILFADSAFFKIFSFQLLRGDAATVLSAPYSIVLSQKAASKYFGNEDPLGKTLKMNGSQDYQITGIVANAPLNSQIDFDMIASFSSLAVSKTEDWWSANYITYVLMQQPGQLNALEQQLKSYMKNNVARNEIHMDGSDYLTYNMEPLKRVHLYSSLEGLEPNGNITYIYVLGIIALLILLIACVNYTNLATAQAAGRGTEIAVRKVMGARRTELFRQFIGESFALTFLALLLAVIIAIVILPLFNSITGKEFTASMLFRPLLLLALFFMSVLVGLVAGAYPALILSGTGLASILKSGIRISNSGGGLRKSLIIFQFIISVFLIIATIVVSSQISYIRHKKLGFDKDQVLVLPVDMKMKTGYEDLKNAFKLNPGVISVTGAYEDPTFIEWGDGISADNGKEKKSLKVNAIPVDLDFTRTMGMEMAAGSDFVRSDFSLQDTSNDYVNFKYAYIINEKAMHELGWTAGQAIGQTIQKGAPGTIRGVVKDFHFASMHTPIGPLVIFLDTSLVRQMFVKIRSNDVATTLRSLEQTWKERVAWRPFDYHFLDEDFDALYRTEQRTANLFTLFSTLAIALACLGLFALAAYSTVQRTKEIGIRKVLGASISQITIIVAKEFIVLVLIAICIATPLAWIAGKRWLQDFAYRIDVAWWMIAGAALVSVAIALATVSYHAIRAALSNPIKSLRTD